jgi:hypothetical protein
MTSKATNISNKQEFGLCKSTNHNWNQLLSDIRDWQSKNPTAATFVKPRRFATFYPQWDEIITDKFRYSYGKACKEIIGTSKQSKFKKRASNFCFFCIFLNQYLSNLFFLEQTNSCKEETKGGQENVSSRREGTRAEEEYQGRLF